MPVSNKHAHTSASVVLNSLVTYCSCCTFHTFLIILTQSFMFCNLYVLQMHRQRLEVGVKVAQFGKTGTDMFELRLQSPVCTLVGFAAAIASCVKYSK